LRQSLSKHLRNVRRGQSLAILDRKTPIAQIVPFPQDGFSLPARRPLEGSTPPNKLRWPGPVKLHHDPVAMLLAERAER
jgi:antitoxin (DNA-binding transcriptional repressor) of toxin-antitoxin stability system